MSNSRIPALRPTPLAAWVLAWMVLLSGCDRDSIGSTRPAAKGDPTGSSAATLLDLSGRAVEPFDASGAKAIVFVFISTDCPISNRYAPEIRRVEEEFAPSGVRFWLVYADSDTTPDAIRKHVKEYRLPQQIVRDPYHALVRLAQARVTPEAAVFLPGRRLVYHGRIDNRYADLGKE